MTKLQFTIQFINSRTEPFRNADARMYSFENGHSEIGINYNYINYMHRAGYIKRIEVGLYEKCSDIPTDITTTELKKLAYDNNYKRLVKINKLMGNE